MNKNVWLAVGIVVVVVAIGLYVAGKFPGVQSGGSEQINVQSGAAQSSSPIPKPPALPH